MPTGPGERQRFPCHLTTHERWHHLTKLVDNGAVDHLTEIA